MKKTSSDRSRSTKIKQCITAVLAFIVGLVALYHHFERKDPQSNTPAYRIAHGIYAGQINELRIKNSLLRFPPNYLPNPYTTGKVIKGQADYVSVNIDLGPPFDQFNVKPAPFDSPVAAEIHAYGIEDIQRGRQILRGKWLHIEELQEIGLRMYISEKDDGGWGYRVYSPVKPDVTTPKGGPIIFECAGPPHDAPNRCRVRYQYSQGPLVVYYVKGRLLPDWQRVHSRVINVIDSFFMSSKGKKMAGVFLQKWEMDIIRQEYDKGLNANGNYSNLYETTGALLSSHRDARDVTNWFFGAAQANAGTGTYSTLIRDYSYRWQCMGCHYAHGESLSAAIRGHSRQRSSGG